MTHEVFSDHVLMLTQEGKRIYEEVNGYTRFKEIGSFCVWFWDHPDSENNRLRIRTDRILEIVTTKGHM